MRPGRRAPRPIRSAAIEPPGVIRVVHRRCRSGSLRAAVAPTRLTAGLRNRASRCRRRSSLPTIAPDVESGGAAAPPSLAILPFLDLVGDPDGRRRGEGLAEELVDALVQVPGLKVVARTSAFRFGNAAQDVREIARELGVQTVLEGSIAAARDGYRVIAQLVGGADGMHLWSHAFEAESHELAKLVPRLARSVASGLRLGGGSASVLRRAAQRMSGDAAAHEAFHRGKYLLGRHSLDGYRRALACFDEALARTAARTAPAAGRSAARRLTAISRRAARATSASP